jgi:hypothetical protein
MVFSIKQINKNNGYNYIDVIQYSPEDIDREIYKNSISPDFEDTGESVLVKSGSEDNNISLWLWFLIVFIFTLLILISIWYYKIFPKSWFRKNKS